MDSGISGELEYHQRLYSGFAQQHFARPAVRALRAHLVGRILRLTGASPGARVLSLGCGIADTELLLAPHVGEIVGVDLAPAAIRQAREDAARLGVRNAQFLEGAFEEMDFPPGYFDVVIGIFFLHHLPDGVLDEIPRLVAGLLAPGGRFYSLDPSRYRLSGAIGRVVVPSLMRKYQSPGERELDPARTAQRFRAAGLECRYDIYDFFSTPLAGLAPGWRAGYAAARAADNLIVRLPLVRRLGSNFEIIAAKSR